MNRVKSGFILALVYLVTLVPCPAVGALLLPEFSIDEPVAGVDAFSQRWPAVAFNGSVYVTAWVDEAQFPIAGIRMQRFNVVGAPLGEAQVLPETNSFAPEIASNGREFMIMWRRDNTNGTPQSFAARLDAAGNFIPDSIVGPAVIGDFPKIASNGTDYMVFATWPRPAYSRLTTAGFGPVSYINMQFPSATGAAIASNGADYLAVFCDESSSPRRIVANRISGSGALVDASPFVIATGASVYGPSVGFARGVYLITWQTPRVYAADIFAKRVASNGDILDSTPITVSASAAEGSAVVGPHGDGFIVAWQRLDYLNERYEFWCRTVSTTGQLSGESMISNRGTSAIQQFAINALGPNSMFVWITYRDETDYDAFANFIPANGVPGPTQILQRGPNVESAPAVAFGANGYLVVWQDNRNSITNDDDIYGRFIDEYGRPKGEAFPISRSRADQSSPVVAAAGDRYLVAWREIDRPSATEDDVKGALLVNDTIVKEFTFSSLTNSQRAPAIASNGSDFLVVWRDGRNIAFDDLGIRIADDDIYGIHVTRDGVLSGPENGFPITTNVEAQTAPAVASNGTNYLVVWRDNRNRDLAADDLYGAIVEAGSTNVPADFAISAYSTTQRAAEVASNGRDYFVVWRDDRNRSLVSTWVGIYGVAVSASGVVSDPIGFGLTPRAVNAQREPSIARLGENYVLGWLEDSVTNGGFYNAFARQIGADGSTNSPVFKLSDTTYDAETLFIAGDSTGGALLVSQTIDPISRIKAAPVCFTCPIVVTASIATNARTLTWNAEANQKYRVEFTTDLNAPNWQLLEQVTTSAEGFARVNDTAQSSIRFYRINRVP